MVTVLIAILTFIIGVISGAVLLAAVAILVAHDSMRVIPLKVRKNGRRTKPWLLRAWLIFKAYAKENL